eukprot:4617098-Amphidinium_carterae.1
MQYLPSCQSMANIEHLLDRFYLVAHTNLVLELSDVNEGLEAGCQFERFPKSHMLAVTEQHAMSWPWLGCRQHPAL